MILDNHRLHFYDWGPKEIDNISDLIDFLFTWSDTPQGEGYWSLIYSKYFNKKLLMYKTLYDIT